MKIGKKRQRISDGSIVKIELMNNKLAFGRLLFRKFAVYDLLIESSQKLPSLKEIIANPVLFYCTVFDGVITKGEFEIIGNITLTQSEISDVPPMFNQDIGDINNCTISWPDGSEKKVLPQECIGLERSSVSNAKGIRDRIEDHYAGRKNPYVELEKVILSTDDIRYNPPPLTLRWNFEKQEYELDYKAAEQDKEKMQNDFLLLRSKKVLQKKQLGDTR